MPATGAFSECASTSCARPTSLIFAFMVLLSSTFFVLRSECITCGRKEGQPMDRRLNDLGVQCHLRHVACQT